MIQWYAASPRPFRHSDVECEVHGGDGHSFLREELFAISRLEATRTVGNGLVAHAAKHVVLREHAGDSVRQGMLVRVGGIHRNAWKLAAVASEARSS